MIFEKNEQKLSLAEFEKEVGFLFKEGLDFESDKDLQKIRKKTQKLYEKGELSIAQVWQGKFFERDLKTRKNPSLAIRWIDETFGWGVFAMEDLAKGRLIAEYSGKVRKRRKEDEKNSYCFEYVNASDQGTKYSIDARDQGGIARFINHSENPNLESSLMTFDFLTHVILLTKRAVAKGEQLCYHYGPTYWSKRSKPYPL